MANVEKRRRSARGLILILALWFVYPAQAQTGNSTIEGQLRAGGGGQLTGVRVRLLLRNTHRLITETFTRSDGRFTFTQLPAGEYVVETFETEDFEASATGISVQPFPPTAPIVVPALIELQHKSTANPVAPGVLRADVDLSVPKEASKHYHNGLKALAEGDSARGVKELKAAIEAYPNYYAARLALGKEFLAKNNLPEAAEALKPLKQIAPRLAEPRVEYGLALLGLGQREEAISELQAAVQLEEANWATHFFLGVVQLSTDRNAAAEHLRRAIKLDERKAARAHLYLAKIANAQGQRQETIEHLNAYLALAPTAPDAEEIRKTVKRLSAK